MKCPIELHGVCLEFQGSLACVCVLQCLIYLYVPYMISLLIKLRACFSNFYIRPTENQRGRLQQCGVREEVRAHGPPHLRYREPYGDGRGEQVKGTSWCLTQVEARGGPGAGEGGAARPAEKCSRGLYSAAIYCRPVAIPYYHSSYYGMKIVSLISYINSDYADFSLFPIITLGKNKLF